LVVVPLGFVAENIETLWDIEIDLKSHARELGFQGFVRVDCPNDDASVMDGLAELITAAIG
jgi:protoheme ferro-lyase